MFGGFVGVERETEREGWRREKRGREKRLE